MSLLSHQVKLNNGKTEVDLESICLRLLMIGQKRQVDLEQLFAYELGAVSCALIDGFGCLRKSSKSALAKRLGDVNISTRAASTVIVDVSQLFYHMVWPNGGSPADLISSIQARLDRYADSVEKILGFDKYKTLSAKDHERMRRSGEVVVDYDLSLASPLPKREAIMKSKKNKQRLARILGTFNLGENVKMETPDDGLFDHDKADVTIVSCMLECTKSNQGVVQVLSDDTDVFILLVYWVYRANVQCRVQMERWDGMILDVNATCSTHGPNVCSSLPCKLSADAT